MQPPDILQALYDSEINFSVSCFWDSGFVVKLGDPVNGIAAEAVVRRWDEIETWLSRMTARHLPESDFAKSLTAIKPTDNG